MSIAARAWWVPVVGLTLAANPVVVAQPPADPAKPAEPTAKPKEPEFPKEIGGKDLNWYLKEASMRNQRDPQLREAAVRTIPLFGPTAREPAVRVITDVIQDDPDPGVKVAAITIISSMGFDLRKQVKPSIKTLQTVLRLNQSGGNSVVKMYCVRSLASFGPDAVEAVSDLRQAAGDPSWETRLAVAEALGAVGAPPKPGDDPNVLAAKTLLTYCLGSPSRTEPCVAVRLEAVKSLLVIGPPKAANPEAYKKEVKEYLDPLANRLAYEGGPNGDKGVYLWLLLLQVMYNGDTMVENTKKITKFIETPEGQNAAVLRMYALQALGLIGPQLAVMRVNPQPPAPPTSPVLDKTIDTVVAALTYPEQPLQVAAMQCLARIGKEARAAVPALEKFKAKETERLKAQALKKPEGAPIDWKPDDTLVKVADETIDYVTGKKRFDDQPGDKKAEKKDEPKKDGK